MRIGNAVLAVIGVLVLGYAIASPYITVYQIKTAGEQGDGEALSEHVEFPTLRQSLKDQLNAQMLAEVSKGGDDDPFAAMGAAFAGMMVDKLVDAYVTPAGVTELMKGEAFDPSGGGDQTESGADKPFEDAQLRYVSWDKFQVSVTDDAGETMRFNLRRRGIGWKLTEILLPEPEA